MRNKDGLTKKLEFAQNRHEFERIEIYAMVDISNKMRRIISRKKTLTNVTRDPFLAQIAGRHSSNYPPFFSILLSLKIYNTLKSKNFGQFKFRTSVCPKFRRLIIQARTPVVGKGYQKSVSYM